MNTITPMFRKPVLRTAQITYHSDVTRSDSPVIPLGVMCDFALAPHYGLGLMTRARITEGESEAVGRLVRDAISEPWEMLLAEYNRVIESDDHASLFGNLELEHHGALTFAFMAPLSVELPIALHSNLEVDDIVHPFMEDRVTAHLMESYWKLLNDDRNWINSIGRKPIRTHVVLPQAA